MGKKEKLETIKTLDFSFVEKRFHHKYAIDIKGLTFGYTPEKPLIDHFTISVGARDRVFVVGKNGKGKTTLLKLIAGVLRPRSGEISSPMSVSPGYFEQTNVTGLSESNTVLDELASANAGGDTKRPRFIAGAMMFEDDDALKPIRVLSGGEKSRVMLGKILATPVNLLLLDEPTNHLDMDSSDALLAALDNFDGAVVMVTHNEMFLHALAERLIVFQDDKIMVHEGGYQRFLDKIGWKDEEDRLGSRLRDSADRAEAKPRSTPKEARRLRSEIVREKSKALKPLEQRMADIELDIETLDKDMKRMNTDIADASQAKNGSRVVELARAMHEAKIRIEVLFKELEFLTAEHEAKSAEYAEKLLSLDEEPSCPAGEGPSES